MNITQGNRRRKLRSHGPGKYRQSRLSRRVRHGGQQERLDPLGAGGTRQAAQVPAHVRGVPRADRQQDRRAGAF